jgi:hypothetical protein
VQNVKSIRRFLAVAVLCFPAVLQAQNIGMGHTYESVEALALSVTTTFRDGVVVRTDRVGGGDLQTTLRNAEGDVVARLDAFRAKGELRFDVSDDNLARQYVARTDRPLTADWANVQLYRTWNDVTASPSHRAGRTGLLVWNGDFLTTPKGRSAVQALTRDDAAADVARVVTDFGGIEVRSSRRYDAVAETATFTTGLFAAEGNALVTMAWYGEVQTLAWRMPDGTVGRVGSQTIPAGWTFQPNEAWANVQAFSFYRHAAEEGRLTPRPVGREQRTVVADADMDGCTGLHWLDQTIFRECCDTHDRCYMKEDPDCTAFSWIWPGSWNCFLCNLQAVWCFITGGGGKGDPWQPPLGDNSECQAGDPLGCPASCRSCG